MKLRVIILTLSLLLFGINTPAFADFNDGYDAYQRGDYKTAVMWYRKSANQGFANAQYNLGVMYDTGQGVLKNDKQAVRWYRKSADQGFANAQFNLGVMYANGQGVLKNDKQAVMWYRKSANQGFANAQTNLGLMYEDGKGVLQDYKQAVMWYRKSANQGFANAQYNLGVMYDTGQGVLKNDKQAVMWYRKSADQGFANAQFNLGVMYANGQGVLKDGKQAVRWYQKAANQGDGDAQYNLGFMYDTGKGVLKDGKQAVRWYRKASEQGKNKAQYNLALLYEYGSLGIDKNYKMAIKYYKKSINGNQLSRDSKNLAIQKITRLTTKLGPNNTNNGFADLWQQYGGEISATTNDYMYQPDFTIPVVADEQPPVIHIIQGDSISITESQVTLSGLAIDDSTISEILVDGELVTINASGGFSAKLYVPLGEKKVLVSATDSKGNNATKIVTITRKEPVYKNKDKELVPPWKNTVHNPNAVALIIGIDEYEVIANAQWAESDAGMFYDFANKALGISIDRIKLIRGDKSDMRGIWKSVEQWLPAHVNEKKSDVYVYFAGHGLASENGDDVYLIPWDGDPELLKRTALKRSEFIDTLQSLNAASVTLFMDTCYSGKSKGGKGVLVADARGLRIVKKEKASDIPPNFTLFSAAASDETARSHPSLKHGLFSYWMMRGLGGEADTNGDRKLTNGELHSFVSKKVQQTAATIGHKQHPQLVGDKDKIIASW